MSHSWGPKTHSCAGRSRSQHRRMRIPSNSRLATSRFTRGTTAIGACGPGSHYACPDRGGKISAITRTTEDPQMSKGMDKKREDKKKPLHTKDEKRALKREKKRQKGLI